MKTFISLFLCKKEEVVHKKVLIFFVVIENLKQILWGRLSSWHAKRQFLRGRMKNGKQSIHASYISGLWEMMISVGDPLEEFSTAQMFKTMSLYKYWNFFLYLFYSL